MDNNSNNNLRNMLNRRTSTSNRNEPKDLKKTTFNKMPGDMKKESSFPTGNMPGSSLTKNNELDNKHDRSKRQAFADNDKKLNKDDGSKLQQARANDAQNHDFAKSFAGNPNDIEAGYQNGINGINGNNQVNKSRVNNPNNDNRYNAQPKNNRAFDLNNRRNAEEQKPVQDGNKQGGKTPAGNNKAPGNTPKNKKSPSTANKKPNNAKSGASNAAKKAAQIGNNLAKAGAMANAAEELLNDEESASEKAKKLAKEKAKQIVRKKVIAGVASFLLPILPYILIGALILAAVLLVILFIASIFSFLNDTNNIYGTMEINYCSKVNLSWVETDEWEAGEVEISSDEYIDFLIEQSPYNVIGDNETMKAVAMIYRTNFYANANNLDSDVCHYEIAAPYEGVFNETVKTAIQETDNKVFALQKDVLSELYLDDKFSYTSTEELAGYPVYRLYQDNLAYKTEWVDENISEDNRENRNAEQMYSFSPFAAYYLVDVKHFNYEALLYHFYSPGNTYTQIYNVKKKGGGWGPDGWGQNGGCSDIPLSSTPLSREEFIAAVESKVSNPDFKNNAGRIYDICVENNFNPELVIIRAYLEGHFSEQGGRYNYFGIRCYNGVSKCKDFSSMDEAVLSYIQIIQGYNFSTIQEVMKLYADIGEFWFNPGGSGIGGCYYYPYIKQYLSEQRAAEVANYCAEGKKCAKGGVGDCVKTTEEDDYAYSLWQVQRMVEERQKFFGIGAAECPSGGEGYTEETGDPNSLGARVAKYAVETYDPWLYSQTRRDEQGYVDCSSMVKRAYEHFGVRIYDQSYSSAEEYKWCENHGGVISGSSLQPGDLIFYATGTHAHNGYYRNIGHVSMFIGNGQIFAAHGEWDNKKKGIRKPPEKQVSVSPYRGDGTYFCRPSNTIH